ncbi:MAG TPA: YbhB/YbcL family Raf kinase inhibitor-like protein [Acetobacteraceae bacterium]|nr:YbhB/YbcL family Raf kinase inhibitor-like protein [Acetobacteraceae bacterium]
MRSFLFAAGLCMLAAPALAAGFTVTSAAFANGGTIPMAQVFNGDGCKGGDHSPAISWSGAPAGTKSFAVTMYDPDAPTGSGWWHWTVFNIPPTVHSLAADAGAAGSSLLPVGAGEGRTDFGFSHYGGPCPPVGEPPHHYEITVFAVKVAKLPLNAHASGATVGFVLHFNTLATARIIGRYGRPH